MPNTNCLEGFHCPECGHEDDFDIAATCIVTVHDDGTENERCIEWDSPSFCWCGACNHGGTVAEFTTKGATP